MVKLRRSLTGVGFLLMLTAATALAVFPQLSTDLTGPAIDGVVPRGTAEVHQTQFPGTLDVRVSRVNLPDGTVLTVIMTDCLQQEVGTITIEKGRARASILLPSEPSVCQVGHNSSIFLKLGETTVLGGGAPWQVR